MIGRPRRASNLSDSQYSDDEIQPL